MPAPPQRHIGPEGIGARSGDAMRAFVERGLGSWLEKGSGQDQHLSAAARKKIGGDPAPHRSGVVGVLNGCRGRFCFLLLAKSFASL